MTKLFEDERLHEAVSSAIDSIAPTWPLDRMIAVNPYWGRIRQPFADAAASLANLAGSPLTLPISEYRQAWQRGEIIMQDLHQALERAARDWPPSG